MRPFKINEEQQAILMKKFSEYLQNCKLVDNKINFSDTFADVKNKNKVFITFDMKAYIKMRDIVDRFESEVGWYGFIDKISDYEYHVTDICVYPQIVTGSTVKETNEPWDDDMPMDQIRRRHFHGHSHVNMAVNPSYTDMQHRENQISMVKKDSFYVFMITNKKCDWTAAVYDLNGNTVYNTNDILIDVDLGDGEMLSDFVDQAKKMVTKHTATSYNNPNNFTATNPWMPKGAASTSSYVPASFNKEKNKKSSGKTKYKGKSVKQLGIFEEENDNEETGVTLKDLIAAEEAASCAEDYYDDILGHVSDSPAICSREILRTMR